MSRTGRYVVVAESGPDGSKFEIIDALGTAPRFLLANEPPDEFVVVGQEVWSIRGDQLAIHAGTGERLAELDLGESGVTLFPSLRGDACTAVARLSGGDRLIAYDDTASMSPIDDSFAGCDLLVALHGQRIVGVRDREFMIGLSPQAPQGRGSLPGDGTANGASELLGGKALVIVSANANGHAFDVVRLSGSLIHHIEVPELASYAIAERRGLAIAYSVRRGQAGARPGSSGDGDEARRNSLVAIDLRYGRVVHSASPPVTPIALDIDSDAQHVVIAGYHHGATRLSVYHVPFADVFLKDRAKVSTSAADESSQTSDAGEDEPAKAQQNGGANSKRELSIELEDDGLGNPIGEGGEGRPASDAVNEQPEVIEIPQLPLRGLRDDAPLPDVSASPGVDAYKDPLAHLSDLLDLVVARTAHAIANAWDSGELSQPLADGLPFEKEVRALIGHRASEAPKLLAESRSAMERIRESVDARTRATYAAKIELPFHQVARQFKLSPLATDILQVVAAPSLRREAARLFGILANDVARPVCDRALVEAVLGTTPAVRHAVAAELGSDAPLLLNGLVRATQTGTSDRLFSSLAVDSVLLRRLTGDGQPVGAPGAVSAVRWADRSLDELVVPDVVKRDIVISLLEPSTSPPRIVVRGRPGLGRTSLLAAIAARVEMPLVVIDTERLAADASFPARLRGELQQAVLRGGLPCVSGLESRPRGEHDQLEHVREVFRTFPGPITFRTSVDYQPPLDPGFGSHTLPTLLESQRHNAWDAALKRRDLEASSVARLAARYLVGPGTIESIVSTVAARNGERFAVGTARKADLGDELDRGARQHLEARLGDVASRVDRLARWEQVALPDEMIDSIREFIGRVVHRRTVYEQWGFADKMATSRGLTALFYGQPGTGKTMVAGLIARELGLDLYRVDLANVTSKWIGETEKNLGKVFDAAEDGQAVILFDEADSLFAKRTEVKSSVDRYANLEVNYLLQRFDTFEGVAILTTNLEGSIDSAFKRRLSLRLEFPFPDEDMRVRLWAAHIPSQAPTRGDFDFVSLAQKFPMSGGYIRNSTLRAAFLAAQEGTLLSQEHLERAIHLEYRELGKLSPGGRMA